jgi:acetyl-CoA carboxylase biotin carboxyl carrier protein
LTSLPRGTNNTRLLSKRRKHVIVKEKVRLDLKELKEILQILDEKDIAEFELEEQGIKLRIRKAAPNLPAAVLVPATLSAPVAAAAAAPGSAPEAEPRPVPAPGSGATVEEGLHVIKSPIVGTFYRSRDPNSPPFVEPGDRVKAGQVLCIIEAMKMMNEIESEVAGEVVRVFRENGNPVQYGEPLFSVRP